MIIENLKCYERSPGYGRVGDGIGSSPLGVVKLVNISKNIVKVEKIQNGKQL